MAMYADTSDGHQLELASPAGKFRGTVLVSSQQHLYRAFLGIPFAQPPVGNLRFAKPKPYPKIENVFDATKLPPIAIQPIGVDLGSPAQEDCLYLNVFTPVVHNTEAGSDEKPLKKVFVYIHGGCFFMGSTREYMPGDLVALGNIIVVTFNYRLSWLGFLKGNTPELPGNQGMWDQVMALKWVKDNIRSFGGDPDDITLGGNSMGGESITALSIIPLGKDLFTKALIMSGTMFASPSTFGSSDVLLDLLTDRVGCKHEDINEVVKSLRELPEEKFVLPLEGYFTNKFTTIDGEMFPRPIGEMIKDEQYLDSVGFYSRDYLLSLTNNEGAIMFHGPTAIGVDPDFMPPKVLAERFRLPLDASKKIVEWYNQKGHYSYKPGHDITGDRILGMPMFQFLETFGARKAGKQGKSYFLWFDYEPTYLPPPLEGVGHELDLPYLFDMTPEEAVSKFYGLHTDKTFTETDYKLKNLYIAILASFMKTRDPGGPLNEHYKLQWPAFEENSEHYLSLGVEPAVKQFPLKERRQLWDIILPQSSQDSKNSQKKEEL